jgi:hypothetical protein
MRLRILFFAICVIAIATQVPQMLAQDYSVDSDIQLLRADIRNDKVKIMTDQMQLNDTEGKAFWPIYNDYQHELDKLNDQKVALIKEYASNYDNISDKEVQSLADRAFALQKKRIDLRQQYFKKISKAVSPKSAARFAQVEDRIDLLLNLQLASSMPMVNNK